MWAMKGAGGGVVCVRKIHIISVYNNMVVLRPQEPKYSKTLNSTHVKHKE